MFFVILTTPSFIHKISLFNFVRLPTIIFLQLILLYSMILFNKLEKKGSLCCYIIKA